jgi:hypothetical protein
VPRAAAHPPEERLYVCARCAAALLPDAAPVRSRQRDRDARPDRREAASVLEKLREKTGETILLGQRRDREGWLSDRIGRLKIILPGCLIAALTYFPLFAALTHFANPELEAFSDHNRVTVTADASTCELHVFVTAFTKFSTRDRAQDLVTKLGVSFKTENAANSGDKVNLTIGATTVEGFDANKWNAAFLDAGYPNLQRNKDGKIAPKPADLTKVNWFMIEAVLVIMVIYAAMVYGPVAAFLVELFPTGIRYTSMSLSYHIGAGVFGGMLPLLATAVVAATSNIYSGLRSRSHDRDCRRTPAARHQGCRYRGRVRRRSCATRMIEIGHPVIRNVRNLINC